MPYCTTPLLGALLALRMHRRRAAMGPCVSLSYPSAFLSWSLSSSTNLHRVIKSLQWAFCPVRCCMSVISIVHTRPPPPWFSGEQEKRKKSSLIIPLSLSLLLYVFYKSIWYLLFLSPIHVCPMVSGQTSHIRGCAGLTNSSVNITA